MGERPASTPQRIGKPSAARVPSPAKKCTECQRAADRAEQEGKPRSPVRDVLSWKVDGRTYFGALCGACSAHEHCRRFQVVRRKARPDELSRLDQKHFERCRSLNQNCLCDEVLREERELAKRRKGALHPCSSGCERMLLPGVGRCYECSIGRPPPVRDYPVFDAPALADAATPAPLEPEHFGPPAEADAPPDEDFAFGDYR